MTVKELIQMREALLKEMNALVDGADAEKRSLNEDEAKRFDEMKAELANLDKSIEAKRTLDNMKTTVVDDPEPEPQTRAKEPEPSQDELEVREFAGFVRSQISGEVRTVTNMTKGDNGAVIPSSIANKIIEEVEEICPVFKDAERYNVKGTLTIPFYDKSSGDITMTYADEFTDGESTSGKISNISLTGFLGRAITDVSKSLINNSDIDIVNFVVRHMSKSIARFIEHELLVGSPAHDDVPAKILGLSTLEAGVTTANKSKVTIDELIDLQELVPDVYQAGSYWIMSRKTRAEIRKLKDGTGNYLLNRDLNARWGYTLLGKDVYCSDNMGELGNTSTTIIYYGNMDGLAVKVSEDINIDVL
ncbi:MAG: phage major capsid protein, partial [Spirochaetales bacterium]|nr:phage major capsid protein [Spirochaetales bacterium]